MRHSIGYLGRYERGFEGLRPGVREYLREDGSIGHVDERPTDVDGIFFGYMERSGKIFVAVRAQYGEINVIVENAVLLKPARHTDGKGFGPKPSRFGDASARCLLTDLVAANPQQAVDLERIADKVGLGPLSALSTVEAVALEDKSLGQLLDTLQRFISEIPQTDEPTSLSPEQRAREIASSAAIKAALLSGSLALPPGPVGYVTIIPDLIGIWRIQAQMVADIAAAFGKQAYLTREQMLFCLFKHTAAQAVRDLVVRVGERVFIRRPALRVIQQILRKIGVRITQRLAGGAIARWLPIVGALGVGAYAYYDTGQVADTAIDLFHRDISIE